MKEVLRFEKIKVYKGYVVLWPLSSDVQYTSIGWMVCNLVPKNLQKKAKNGQKRGLRQTYLVPGFSFKFDKYGAVRKSIKFYTNGTEESLSRLIV